MLAGEVLKKRKARLSPLEEDLLGALGSASTEQRTRNVRVTNEELAVAVEAPLRSVQRSLQQLRTKGFIATKTRGWRGSIITLREVQVRAAPSLPKPAGEDQRSRTRYGLVAVPPGFCGDEEAYTTAVLLRRVGSGTKSPVAFANLYLDRASGDELSRLETLRDDRNLYLIESVLTGDLDLDEGLRTLAESEYRRERLRDALL